MVTESMQQIIDRVQTLSPEEQNHLAAQFQYLIERPAPIQQGVRPDVMAAFEEAYRRSTAVLDYLRDK